MKKLFPAFGLVIVFFLLAGKGIPFDPRKQESRLIQNINADWEYLEYNLNEAPLLRQQNNWQALDLPHSWNQWDECFFIPGILLPPCRGGCFYRPPGASNRSIQ